MLRDGGLFEAERCHDFTNGTLLQRQEIEDFAAPRLGDGVESVRRGSSAWHDPNIFLYRNMSSIFFGGKGLRTPSRGISPVSPRRLRANPGGWLAARL